MRTRQIRIKGRVQGVGFRDALRAQAQRLGLSGWVRNRTDGSVEALLQGDKRSIDVLIAWARHGPALARVSQLDDADADAAFNRVYTGFERWPTA
jgi:acylphosphatase